MVKAATSIVLIFGQLAVLAAAPVYICTSADGTQRLEWGACECHEEHGHVSIGRHEWQENAAPACDLHLSEPPCHCEHQPLSDDLRLISRANPGTRGTVIVAHAGDCDLLGCQTTAHALRVVDSAPRGHTPLLDRLSICLRC
jgi:hypothetical protein